MVRPGTCLPKARTIGRVIEWSPPRQTGRKPLSSNSPTFFSMAANGSSKVNFKSPASQSVPSAPRSTPVSVHEFAEMELKATRIMGGAPAAPRNQEELASNGTPRMTGVPGLAVSGRCVMEVFLCFRIIGGRASGCDPRHTGRLIRYSIEDLLWRLQPGILAGTLLPPAIKTTNENVCLACSANLDIWRPN